MAIAATPTQHTAGVGGAATTQTLAFSSNPANNQLVIAAIRYNNNAHTDVSVSAPTSGFTQATFADKSAITTLIYFAVGDGTANFKTWTFNGISGAADIALIEWFADNGWVLGSTLDKTNSKASAATATTGDTNSTGTLTTAAELAVAAIGMTGVQGAELGWDSGFASPGWDESILGSMMISTKVTAATTALDPTATWTTSRNYAAGIATFMEAAGGGGGTSLVDREVPRGVGRGLTRGVA